MSSTEELLNRLRASGVRLELHGDRLRCSAPKGVLTPELQAELGRHKEQIIGLLRGLASAEPTSTLSIRPYPRQGPIPLSFGQQRLWFLHRMEPESPAYNIPLVFAITDPCEPKVLADCFNAMVRRHEILRTRFAEMDGQPVQVILPELVLEPEIIDFSHLAPAARRPALTRLNEQALRVPFDLAQGPLIRATLIHVGANRHVVSVVMHHIITDGWSLALFKEEFDAHFRAARTGTNALLPALPLHYADYAIWQREWLKGEVLTRELDYWRKQLGGRRPALELPLDRPRPPVQTYAGAVEIFTIRLALVHRLKALALARSSTFFMLLLAAFKVLLHRYSGQSEVLVGTSNGNRNRPEWESMLGFFVNTQVLRTDCSGDPTFVELLERVKQVTLEAYAHQDLPFERLVEELQPERNLSLPPLFQVMFIMQNTPLEAQVKQGQATPDFTAEEAKDYVSESGTSKFDLTLYAIETVKGLEGNFEYSTDLFEAATIRRMLEHFERLLEGIAEDAERPISRLPMLSESEADEILVTWNRTGLDYPSAQAAHELIAAQARRTPGSVAVEHGGQIWTYEELDRRANQLAGHLRGLGVKSGSRVGVCMERSALMLAGLLAIWKAGGSYVPLDPAFPADRLRYMVTDAQLRVILTQESLRSWVASLAPEASEMLAVQQVCLDTEWAPEESQSGEDSESFAGPDDVAYTLYTSGSTGRPKGVQVSHRALVNFLISMQREPGLTADDVLLAVTTLSFDIAGLELYLPLITGARVVIADREVVADGPALAARLAECRATVMQATPATWRMLIESGWQGDARLKVLCGGEALPMGLADQLLTRCGSLWNMYGPTETTIWSTLQKIEPGARDIRVGRPIANTQAYVLDRHFCPVPAGVAGELCLGGDGLALGYWNRPDLTAERFIPCPFGSEPGARMYRTGDLARFRRDGTLECLGRVDHQVKIRGFRIELGEIEAVLLAQPAVRAAVVMAREDVPGEKRLVAYLVAGEGAPNLSDLRVAVRERLPEYMVPSAFVFLEAFPLTPNGKIDRRALPAPTAERAAQDISYEAPRNDAERTVAQIWQEVLHLERVGANDNFFDLGGHSLLLIKVHGRLRSAFSRDVPVLDLFRHPTVSSLARYLAEERPAGPSFDQVQERARRQQARLGGRAPQVMRQRDSA